MKTDGDEPVAIVVLLPVEVGTSMSESHRQLRAHDGASYTPYSYSVIVIENDTASAVDQLSIDWLTNINKWPTDRSTKK